MDKIYSRARIKLPFTSKKKYSSNPKCVRKTKRFLVVMQVFLVAYLTYQIAIKSINPIMEKQCENISKSIATKICNEEATKVMANYKYGDLCVITKDSNGSIAMVSANIITVNEIVSDVAIKIQEELNKIENSEFNIKLGSFTGSKLLSGRGPDVQIKMSTIGNIETNLRSEFESKRNKSNTS